MTDVPHNDAIEQALLGTILLRPSEYMLGVSLILTDDDFFSAKHRLIYKTLNNMWTAREPIDTRLLDDKFTQEESIAIGGVPYLDSLYNDAPADEAVESYARKVRNYAQQRRIMGLGKFAWDAGQNTKSVSKTIDEIATKAIDLSQGATSRQAQPFDTFIPEYQTEYYRRIESGETIKALGFPSGIETLDKHIAGYRPGSFNIIAARPSVGKTAFGTTIAMNIAHAGGNVLFISAEMTKGQITNRMLAFETGLDSFYIDKGVHHLHYDKMNNGFKRLKALPIVIDDRSKSLDRVKNEIRRWVHLKGELGLVVVDYLQQIYVKGVYKDYERITALSMELKRIGQECNVPMLVLAQINREGDKEPKMKDVKGSGQIEQDADSFVILHINKADAIERTKSVNVQVNIAKHRFGPTGKFVMHFQKDQSRFTDMGDGSPVDKQATVPASNIPDVPDVDDDISEYED